MTYIYKNYRFCDMELKTDTQNMRLYMCNSLFARWY